MESIKFKKETQTLKTFFEEYCHNKHKDQLNEKREFVYKDEKSELDLCLCDDCLKKIDYCFKRLLECPHEIKPRCRNCKTPCYGRQEWKDTAKIMKYSGIKLGLSSIKKFLKFS